MSEEEVKVAELIRRAAPRLAEMMVKARTESDGYPWTVAHVGLGFHAETGIISIRLYVGFEDEDEP